MKKMPFGEADFLVRVLTRDFGKMDILAKGARKPNAKLNAHLDMLNEIHLSFVKNGDRIPTLTDAEVLARYDDWFSSADTLSVAGRVLQTLDGIIPAGAGDGEAFSMAKDFFASLPGPGWTTEQMSGAVRSFLKKFFAHEGYGDSLDFSLLPSEVGGVIMKLWPDLKT